jgi:hypothetical protein
MDYDSKQSIIDILDAMKNEQNILVIRTMIKNNYFVKYHEKVHHCFQVFHNKCFNITSILRESFKTLKDH